MTLASQVVEAANVSGNLILDFYRDSKVHVRAKGDSTPVTAADLAADDFLKERLRAILPGSIYVSEESLDGSMSRGQALELVSKSPVCWLVDPLDGTRDFLEGTDDFTVNIALIREGILDFGVMCAPARKLTYMAGKGKGCYKVMEDGSHRLLSGRSADQHPPEVLVSRQHDLGEYALLKAVIPHCEIRPCGSALKYGLLAEGLADFAFRRGPTSIWDTAAAQCILEEAGGAMWTKNGDSLEIWRDTLVNPGFLAVADRKLDISIKEKLLALLSSNKENIKV